MSYPGGKAGAGVYQKIINQIPPHQVYIEPFLGDGAVLLRKRPADFSMAVEIDRDNAVRFQADWPPARGFSDAAGGLYCPANLELHCCCGIEFLRHAFGLYRVRGPWSPDRASPAVAAGSSGEGLQGAGSVHSSGAAGKRRSPAAASGGVGRAARPCAAATSGGGIHRDRAAGRDSTSGHVHQVGHRVRAAGSAGARSSGPAVGPSQLPVAGCFVYCDPPYLLSTRRSQKQLYRHEMTEAQHVELLDVVTRLPCPVAISGYRSPLYDLSLEQWRRIDFLAMTRGGRPAMESLWMNYAAPAELHDYRYLGNEKRERERIARKRRTWAAGLRRLPALERQAVLAEMLG